MCVCVCVCVCVVMYCVCLRIVWMCVYTGGCEASCVIACKSPVLHASCFQLPLPASPVRTEEPSVKVSPCRYIASPLSRPLLCLLVATHGNWVLCGSMLNIRGSRSIKGALEVWDYGLPTCGHALVPHQPLTHSPMGYPRLG